MLRHFIITKQHNLFSLENNAKDIMVKMLQDYKNAGDRAYWNKLFVNGFGKTKFKHACIQSYITFPVTINEKQESAHIMSHLHGEGLSNSLVFAMCFSSLSITISHGGKAKNGYFHCGFQEKS